MKVQKFVLYFFLMNGLGKMHNCHLNWHEGHLYKGRGIEIILILAQKMPEIDFHIIGGRLKDISKYEIKAARFSNVFFHGFIEPNKVYKYRNSCDILLAPYQNRVTVENK